MKNNLIGFNNIQREEREKTELRFSKPIFLILLIISIFLISVNLVSAEDFKVQRGAVQVSGTGVTLNAPADFQAISNLSKAFVRISNTRNTGAGDDSNGGNQNSDDTTATISIINENQIQIERPSTALSNTRVAWEIIEYIGETGGENEFIIRKNGTHTFAGSGVSETESLTEVSNVSKLVGFVTGIRNPDTGRGDYEHQHTSIDFDDASTVRFERGASSSDAVSVSYAIVEFVGENWNIQRIGHTYSSAGSTETETINSVNLSRTFIHTQKRVGNGLNGLDEAGHEIWLSSENELSFIIQSGAGTPSSHDSVVWVIENLQDNGIPMNVERGSFSKSSGQGSEPDSFNVSYGPISNLSIASVFANDKSSGTGTAYPRGVFAVSLASESEINFWYSDDGQAQTGRWEVVEWPTALMGDEDLIIPNVTNLIPSSGQVFESDEEIEISANVSDDINVSSVLANITIPNGTINQITLSNVVGDKYNNSYVIPNIAGRYEILIIASDGVNINDSEITYFDVDANFSFLNLIGYGYLDGNLTNLFYNGSDGCLQLNSSSGSFESQVFDAGMSVSWNNISWVQEASVSGSKILIPTYAEDEWGGDITNTVSSSNDVSTWERVEVQAWNDSLESGTIDSVFGYCEVSDIDAGAQIGFQVSRNNGSSWDSEICIQDVAVNTFFSCDLKTNSGVDTVDEINNLRMRCTFPTAGVNDYYSTDYAYVQVNYSSSTDLNLQVRSDGDNSSWSDFIGPDGTISSYYTNSSFESLNVSDNRYFQYKTFFNQSGKLYNVTIGYGISCTENLQNTSWSSWINDGLCLPDDNQQQIRNRTQYDENNCGYVNETFFEYQNVSCDYCSYDAQNTTKSNWYDITSCNTSDNKIQTRNWTEYDANYDTCYAVTGLPSDLFVNVTWFENQTVSCDYCSYNNINTTWTGWQDYESCLITDEQQQNRSKTEYDENYDICYAITGLPSDLWNSGENITYWEWRNISCDYCTPNRVNTTWSDWYYLESCQSDDTRERQRNLTEYDENTCYAVTGLPSDVSDNVTYFENEDTVCDYCVPSLLNTTKTDWINLTCSGEYMNQSRNWTQYDSLNCVPDNIPNQTFYEYQLVGPNYVNTSWSSWQNISCLIDDTMNQSRNLTQYDSYSCAVNTTFVEYQNIEFCDYCTPDMQNTSWTSWINDGLCLPDDNQQQIRNRTQYDENNCGYVNETFFEYQNVSCDYCSYDAQNTTKSNWYDITSCNTSDNKIQTRNWTEYDANYDTCYAVTGLPSDLFVNVTWFENQTVSCDYCSYNNINTTWTGWQDYESCLITDEQQQNRSKTEYDSNNCYSITGLPSDVFTNTTFWDWQNITCDYCTYSVVNSSWSDWQNISCLIDDTMNQSRFKIEYDDNYGSCYVITGLASDLWNLGLNNTYYEYQNIEFCDYCTPDLVNTTKGDWYFIEGCQSDDTRLRERNWTQYDLNDCEEIENITYFENESTICDYCTPDMQNTSKTEWNNQTSCQINDTYLQNRSWIEYDLNNCGEVLNVTHWEYQELSCDYCSYNNINTTWRNWYYLESCQADDTREQQRNKTEYDENYGSCYLITGLESDLWNSGLNITYFENNTDVCDYCTYNNVNTSAGDWDFTEGCQINDLRNRQRNWTEYDENYSTCYAITNLASDLWNLGNNNTYFENENMSCDFLNINCQVGGPYQQGALVLFIGNVSNFTSVLFNEDVNIEIYKNNEINLSRLLQTSEDGDFETSFSNLSIGNYQINASVSYLGANETCSDEFQIGTPASLVLDKTASIHNLSNNEIYYNISLRVLNKGGSDCNDVNLSDDDFILSPYDLGTLNPDESVILSYLMNFTRQNSTTYYELEIANVQGVDSYSNSLVDSNSSLVNLTIPSSSYSPGKQLVITKNIIFVEETSLNITYNVSSILYNTGDEDLVNVVYTDTDIFGSSILLNLSRGENALFSNLVIVDKAASNTEYEFELGTAVIDSLSFYSNRPKVKVPGYGGPADAIVYADESIPVSTSFDTRISVVNMNPDIGQDFVVDYWITNEDESINYSSGQQTIYVSALGQSNLTASLTSPDSAGDYKFKVVVSWTNGAATSFDSFIVESGGDDGGEGGGDSGGDSGGGGGTTLPKQEANITVDVEGETSKELGGIICNSPYIRYGEECCLDENNNQICDNDETKPGITGRFVDNIDDININYPLMGWLLLLLIILFTLYKLIKKLIKNMKKHPYKKKNVMRVRKVIGLKVYCLEGIEIGKVVDVILKDNKIDALKIKLHKTHRKKKNKHKKKGEKKLHGFLLKYKHVHNIGHIVLVDKVVSEKYLSN